MAIELGSAYGQIVIDASGARKGSQEAQQSILGVTSSILGMTGGMAGLIAGVAGGMGVVEIAKQGFQMLRAEINEDITAASTEETALTQLQATLLSTGRASEISLDELMAFGKGLSGMYDIAQLGKAETILSRLMDIPTSQIPADLPLLENMAAALGETLPAAAQTLGMALETGRLRGLGFSREMQNTISTMMSQGDIAGADAIIMQQLNDKFSGEAAATLMTYAGATDTVDASMQDLRATVAGPYLDSLTLAKLTFADLIHEYILWQSLQNGGKNYGLGQYADTTEYAKMSTDDLNAALKFEEDQLKKVTTETGKAMIGHAELAIKTELAKRASMDFKLVDLPDYLTNLTISTDTATQSEALYGSNLEANTAYQDAYTKAIDAGDDATKAETKAIEAANKAMLGSVEAAHQAIIDASSWEMMYTNAKNATEKSGDAMDLLGKDIQGLGEEGAVVWEGFLVATGKISPEAAAQFVKILETYQHVKEMVAAGIEVDVIVNYLVNSANSINNPEPTNNPGDWKYMGTKNGPGTGSAWFNAKLGQWHFGLTDTGWTKGGEGTVPPGYPNDSYALWVESGEHFNITPAGQASEEKGNVTISQIFYIQGNADENTVRRGAQQGVLEALRAKGLA